MNRPLYICYASSDYYARETGISMIGFFENNPHYEPNELFILDYGILPGSKDKLDGIASHYRKSIHYLPAKQILEKIQIDLGLKDFRGSLATYSRAFIDKILPEYVNRLLYIDSDTVVVNSVDELIEFEMGDACMAGIVTEVYSTLIKKGDMQLYSGNSRYFGCGVVLFDLNNWRRLKCYEKISEMLNIKKIYPCADQTLINNSLPESYFCKLPRKFNYNTHIYGTKFERSLLNRGSWNTQSEIVDAIASPVVVHYPGNPVDRPWYKKCTSRRKDDYLKYKAMSPWSGDTLYDNPDNKGGFSIKFGRFIHSLETRDDLYWLLKFINGIRRIFGGLMRLFGILPPLPNEGVE